MSTYDLTITDIKNETAATWYAEATEDDLTGWTLEAARDRARDLNNPVELRKGRSVVFYVHADGNYWRA